MTVHSGSVIPVLALLSLIQRPKRILELGAGKFSTPEFVNRKLFQGVERLDSFENGTDKYKQECTRVFGVNDDTYRLVLFPYERLMPDIIRDVDLAFYDLILVDDSEDMVIRARTISYVIAHQTNQQIVLVHDLENNLYIRATAAAKHRFIFTAVRPFTAIIWKEFEMPLDKLVQLNKIMKREITNPTQLLEGVHWKEHLIK